MPKNIYMNAGLSLSGDIGTSENYMKDLYAENIIRDGKILVSNEILQPFYPSTNTISNTVLSSLTQVDSEPFASAQWRSIVWGRDRFAVVGNTNEPAFCKFSTDGTNWSPSSTIIDSPLGDGNPGGPMHSIVYSLELDLFVAGGANNVILTSTDANTWTSRNYFAGGGTLTGAAWSPTENIFVMAESGIFYTSNDGESWTKRTSVELAGNGYDNFITWSKLLNKFITSKNTTSIDGINWSGVQTAGANGIASADEIGLLVAGCYYSADVVVSSDHGKTWVLVNFDGDFATRSTRGVVWCKDIGIIAAVTEDRYTPRSTQSFFYSRDGFTWYKGPEVGQRQRCLAWSPELGLLVAPDRDSPSIIRRSSLKTIPTIQNVFNSEYNSINEQGEWSFGNVNATGDLIVGGRVGIGISDESELNKPKPRGVVMIESPAIDPVSNIQEGYFPEGNGQLAVVGGINEFGNTAGNGSLMVFCGSTKADGTDNYRSFGMIGAFKENETDGDRSGYLALGTRYNISPDRDVFERMRITSTGNVGIGTTSPFSERKLHVYNEKDSIIRIESNTESAQTEMVANLTAKTSGSISVNECHSVYRYTWNSSPIATTTGAWFAGIAKDSPVETVTDSIKYRIGTNNTLFSSKLVIDRDGNVGIGTTSPTQRLDVSGNVNATGVGVGLSNESLLNSLGSVIIESPAIDTVAQIQQGIFPAGNGQLALVGGINEFGNTAGNGSLMVFCGSTKADGTDNYRSFGMIGAFKENHINEDRAGYLALGSRSNVAPTDEIIEHMRITSNGDVIISNDKSAVLSLKSGDGTNIDCLINMYENDNLRWTLRNQGDDNDRFHIQNLDEDGITVVKRFTILKDGKVGIGKDNPLQKLHVGDGTDSNVNFQVQNPNGSIYLGTSPNTRFGFDSGKALINQATGNIYAIGTQSGHDVVLGTNNNERIRVTSAGNVGIGTSNPTSTLVVNGTLDVTGDSTFTNIEVSQDATINGNLYVLGTETIVHTRKLSVEDPIIGIGSNATPFTRDFGILMFSNVQNVDAPNGSNVGVIYDEDNNRLSIGYTTNDIHDNKIDFTGNIVTQIYGNLITKDITSSSNLEVNGATLLSNTLTVPNYLSNLHSLEVNGATLLSNTLTVPNDLSNLHSLEVNGATFLTGNLTVTSNVFLGGVSSNIGFFGSTSGYEKQSIADMTIPGATADQCASNINALFGILRNYGLIG